VGWGGVCACVELGENEINSILVEMQPVMDRSLLLDKFASVSVAIKEPEIREKPFALVSQPRSREPADGARRKVRGRGRGREGGSRGGAR
jgi:hypothetical protein